MINLRNDRQRIIDFIDDSIEEFIKANPTEFVSCLGIYACPWSGWVMINFDTQEHSEEHIAKGKLRGSEWFATDEYGQYCNNCPDFKYVDFSQLGFPEWVKEYNENEILNIKVNLFSTIKIDTETDGDEAFNEVLFNYLLKIASEIKNSHQFKRLNMSIPFRVGVQMLDSEYETFWVK